MQQNGVTFGRRRTGYLAPKAVAQTIEVVAEVAPVRRKWPLFTLALMALLIAIYVVELDLSAGPGLSPSLEALDMLGGLHKQLVLEGQWWRVFTGPLLHGSPSHIAFNCLALLLIGLRLEPMIGARWFAGIFALTAICGALMSLTLNPANLIGVGASGGIVGLFTAAMFASVRIPDARARARLIRGTVGSLAPALLPFLSSAHSGGDTIDYGAHFGGATGGIVAGLILLSVWPKTDAMPSGTKWPGVIAAVFFIGSTAAVVPITHGYALTTQLMPWSMVKTANSPGQPEILVTKYPHDPRARLFYSQVLLRANRLSDAEAQLRAGLAETEILRDATPPVTEAFLRAMLAVTLVAEDRKQEAAAMVQPVCGAAGLTAAVNAELKREGLCG